MLRSHGTVVHDDDMTKVEDMEPDETREEVDIEFTECVDEKEENNEPIELLRVG